MSMATLGFESRGPMKLKENATHIQSRSSRTKWNWSMKKRSNQAVERDNQPVALVRSLRASSGRLSLLR